MPHNIEHLTNRALDAFWSVIASVFPDARTGDLSPDRSFALSVAAEDAVTEWVTANAEIDRTSLRCSAVHDLLRLARTCRQAFNERLATLREEREDLLRISDDVEDIDDQIGHYEALVSKCHIAIQKTTAGHVPDSR